MDKIWVLLLGGSLGTLGRYYLAEWANTRLGAMFPYGTLLVNALGCLVIGILLGVLEKRYISLLEAPVQLRLLLMTGFLGAFTTFSSYELEVFLFLRQGFWERALLYLIGSLVMGLVLVAVGARLGRYLPV